MDLIIKDGIVLYDVKFVYDDGRTWIYSNRTDLLIAGFDSSKYCLIEVCYKLFELKEVK